MGKLLRNNLKRNMTINSVIYASEHQDGNDNSKRNMMSFEDHEGNYSSQQTGVADYKGDHDIVDAAVADVANRKAAEPWAVLVVTKTCPNCAAAKKMLDKAGFTYKVVYADDKNGAAIAKENDIVQAPTLLVPAEDGYKKFTNVSEISKFTKASVTA